MPTLQEKESQLQALQEEIAQAEKSIEEDFAKWCDENLDQDTEALFFDDRKAFFRKILELQNQFLQDKLGGKVQQAQELSKDIDNTRTQEENQQAQQAFLSGHPDANIQAMLEFYEQELPPKYRQQLDTLQGQEFYETLYKLYTATQNPEQASDLPQRVQGQPTNPQSSSNGELVMDRF
ncbi:Coiled-coil domain-containing protein [Helicobacter ailurogastricus]|uniref:Coiled-coil domain-containing protein n=1 Tax=Helicobacter ailurogastricus TaxID=1578720 RepID=UPI000CF1AC99|nr:Coiled-coil domain-containing protein [Helicobacter ailurogastricus]